MEAKDIIKKHLNVALNEVGAIEPWWNEEDELFVFEHQAYPMVMYADPDKEATVRGYLRSLEGFIEDRLQGKVAADVDRITPGWGGKRSGSGRPTNDQKSVRRSIPEDIAKWLEQVGYEQIRKMMREAG